MQQLRQEASVFARNFQVWIMPTFSEVGLARPSRSRPLGQGHGVRGGGLGSGRPGPGPPGIKRKHRKGVGFIGGPFAGASSACIVSCLGERTASRRDDWDAAFLARDRREALASMDPSSERRGLPTTFRGRRSFPEAGSVCEGQEGTGREISVTDHCQLIRLHVQSYKPRPRPGETWDAGDHRGR